MAPPWGTIWKALVWTKPHILSLRKLSPREKKGLAKENFLNVFRALLPSFPHVILFAVGCGHIILWEMGCDFPSFTQTVRTGARILTQVFWLQLLLAFSPFHRGIPGLSWGSESCASLKPKFPTIQNPLHVLKRPDSSAYQLSIFIEQAPVTASQSGSVSEFILSSASTHCVVPPPVPCWVKSLECKWFICTCSHSASLSFPCSPEGRGLAGRGQASKGRHEFPVNQGVSTQQEDRVRANKEVGSKKGWLLGVS